MEKNPGGNPIVRPACPEDYSALVDMNLEIYDGLDYFPSLYFTYFHQGRFSPYVVETNGLVVSFVVYEISEDGTVATAMANRVRPSHQGQGLSAEKNYDIIRRLKTDHPRIVKQLYTTRVYPLSLSKVNQSEIFYRWSLMCFKLSEEKANLFRHELKSKLEFPQNESITKVLQYSESLRLLEYGSLESFLAKFTEKYVVFGNNWRPIALNKTGIKLLLLNCQTLISVDEQPSEASPNKEIKRENTTAYAGVSMTKQNGTILRSLQQTSPENIDLDWANIGGTIKAISFMITSKCREIYYSDVFFYGNSESLLLEHALMHGKHGLAITESNYTLILHFPQSISSDGIQYKLENVLGVPRYTKGHFTSTEVVLGIKPM